MMNFLFGKKIMPQHNCFVISGSDLTLIQNRNTVRRLACMWLRCTNAPQFNCCLIESEYKICYACLRGANVIITEGIFPLKWKCCSGSTGTGAQSVKCMSLLELKPMLCRKIFQHIEPNLKLSLYTHFNEHCCYSSLWNEHFGPSNTMNPACCKFPAA